MRSGIKSAKIRRWLNGIKSDEEFCLISVCMRGRAGSVGIKTRAVNNIMQVGVYKHTGLSL